MLKTINYSHTNNSISSILLLPKNSIIFLTSFLLTFLNSDGRYFSMNWKCLQTVTPNTYRVYKDLTAERTHF